MTELADRVARLERRCRHVIVLFGTLIVFLTVGNMWAIYLIQGQANDNKEAICAYRGDLGRRIADGEKFLRDHPDGIPGITASEIIRSLQNQRAAYASLNNVDCN